VIAVSESGLQTRADLERLSAAGYRAFLIGERFMTDPDPARAIAELIGGVRLKPDTTSAQDAPAHDAPARDKTADVRSVRL
jgi:hypothetical protein